MKSLFLILITVLVGILILNGCAQPAPSPTQAPQPAPAPSAALAPAPAPSTSAAAPKATLAAKTWNLKFNHMNPETSPYYIYGHTPWAQDVEKATNGRVKVTQYPNDSLMKSQAAWDGVKSGIADVAWLFTGYFPGQFQFSDSITLPFIAPSGEVASRTAWALYNEFPDIQKQFADVKLLTVWTSEPYFVLTTKKQIKTMEDIKGLKIRATGGPPTDMVKLLGAVPMNMGMNDVYMNLQKGVMDGLLAPGEATMGFRLYEQAKYYTFVPTCAVNFALIMNKDTWNEMPKDVQDSMMSVSGEVQAVRYGGGTYDRIAKDMPAQIKAAGFDMVGYNPPADEVAKWRGLAKPIWEDWVKNMTAKGIPAQKIVDETVSLVDKFTKNPIQK